MDLHRLRALLLPLAGRVSFREKLAATITSFLGILAVAYITQLTTGTHGLMYLSVSMGSAAVLLFAAPHAPMAQPWPLFGGNIISALIGVTCYKLGKDPTLTAALAISISIFAMYLLRCMNPPGGASALGAVVGGTQIHALGYEYVLMPIGVNILVLFVVALFVNNLFPGRRYPLSPVNPDRIKNKDISKFCWRRYLEDEDIETAMDSLNTYIDADRRDLSLIFQLAEMNALRRKTGAVVCHDLMTQPVAVQGSTSVAMAEKLMLDRQLDLIVVTDDNRNYLSTIEKSTLEQFASLDPDTSMDDVMAGDGQQGDLYVQGDQHIVDSVPVFNESGSRNLPVVSGEGKLLGMLSRDRVAHVLMQSRLF